MAPNLPPLLVNDCGYDAARYAVDRWHYSESMPRGVLITYGVWEGDPDVDGAFVGAVIFGRGASPALAQPYGLTQYEACELVRVALRHDHAHPVTTIVARCLTLLREQNPGMRLVLSFADPFEGHHGGIYQAGNWLYLGRTSPSDEIYYDGRWQHNRNARPTGWGTQPKLSRVDTTSLPRRRRPGKYRYAMPLDKAMRRKLVPLALDYPAPVTAVEHESA